MVHLKSVTFEASRTLFMVVADSGRRKIESGREDGEDVVGGGEGENKNEVIKEK